MNLKYQLQHGMIINNDYQQDLIVLYTFVPNKPFESLFIQFIQFIRKFFNKLYLFKII